MNILDENIPAIQRQILWRLHAPGEVCLAWKE